MSLRQDGDVVTGGYFPYNGRLEGTVRGSVLRGTWESPNGRGTLLFTLAPDGNQFSGFVDDGEWWNGRRVDQDEIGALAIDLTSPSHTVRSFLEAGRAFNRGEIAGLQAMFSALQFPEDLAFAERSRRARLLYDVLSLTTFRVFEVRPGRAALPKDAPSMFSHRFEQAGTDESLTLDFRPDVFELWRIDAPEEDYLKKRLRALLAARGLREINPIGHEQLHSPRATVEAFVSGMERWNLGGKELVRQTFDFSAIDERLRDSRLPILATFVASNLNRIGRLTLQEIPDDPESRKPFLYYQHPAGDIVLAPTADADGVRRWQFTPATLASAKRLHDALRSVPTRFDNVRNPRADSLYFSARNLAFDLSPRLIESSGGAELWQWLGLVLLVVALPLALHMLALTTERTVGRSSGMKTSELHSRFTIVFRLLGLGGLWILASTILGLPDSVSGPLYAIGWVIVIVAITWQIYRLVDTGTRSLHAFTQQTASTMDDIVVTLLSGLTKILLVVGAAIAIADVLGLPFQTVLAGVGVSGLALAIASRDLIANLFGSAVIASDRPFKQGDFVSVGDVTGTVENVGLRSTRLRPPDDTAVTIPNSVITTSQVINISKRRKIRVVETIHISHDSTVDEIRALREQIRDELLADDMVAPEPVRVGLSTVSLYAVEMDISFYILTTNFDDYLAHKHRLLAQVLATIEAAGVQRAVIRKD